jgi:hypothetical protein
MINLASASLFHPAFHRTCPGRIVSSLSADFEIRTSIIPGPVKQDTCVHEVIFCPKKGENNFSLTNANRPRAGYSLSLHMGRSIHV